MSSHLDFLQSLSERELCELVLIPLLEELRYIEIRYTHGPRESGKDIIFCKPDPLAGQIYYCAVVKCQKLSGSVDSNQSVRTVHFQVSQALKQPFTSPFDATSITISRAFVVTPFEIAPAAVASITGELLDLSNRVSFIDGPTLVGLLETHYPTLLSSLPDPTSRYLHSLSRRLMSSIRLTDMGAAAQLTLADIYTGGDLSPTSIEEARVISFARPEIGTTKHSAMDALSKTPHAVVLADVGAGKTTLLNKLALDVINSGASDGSRETKLIPVLVPLHALPQDALKHSSMFSAAIEAYVQHTEGLFDFSTAQGGRYVLLLDGFDELRSEHDAVSSHILNLSSRFPKGLLLTSRPSRIPTKLGKFAFYKLNPFTDGNIQEFLSRWFPKKESLRTLLFEKISSDSTLHAFCRNPLFLTLYSILASRFSLDLLPARRTDIYSKISSMLLGEWDAAKAVRNEFSLTVKDVLLQTLAFEAHSANQRQFSGYHFERAIEEIFQSLGREIKWSEMEMLADEVIYRSSLIRTKDPIPEQSFRYQGSFEFAHLSFQEFFCARYLMRTGNTRLLQQRLFDEWWRNTLVFYFGIKQSMEGVAIPIGKVTEGNGITLMEFLAEATFTAQETKYRVYQAMGADLLYSMKASSEELETCAKAGDQFLESLRKTVVDKKFNGVTFNYLRLLLASGTSKARSLMRQEKQLFKRLNDRELMILLCEGAPLLKNEGWIDDLIEIVGNIKKGGGVPQSKSDWEKSEYLQRFQKDLNNSVKRGDVKKKDALVLTQLTKAAIL